VLDQGLLHSQLQGAAPGVANIPSYRVLHQGLLKLPSTGCLLWLIF
jgi:hypothetical protein